MYNVTNGALYPPASNAKRSTGTYVPRGAGGGLEVVEAVAVEAVEALVVPVEGARFSFVPSSSLTVLAAWLGDAGGEVEEDDDKRRDFSIRCKASASRRSFVTRAVKCNRAVGRSNAAAARSKSCASNRRSCDGNRSETAGASMSASTAFSSTFASAAVRFATVPLPDSSGMSSSIWTMFESTS